MGKRVSLQTEIANCNAKKRALILLEGHTDKKIYERIISEKFTNDKYRVLSVKELADSNSGGCNEIKNVLIENREYLNKYKSAKRVLLGIVDGDASVYRKNKRTNEEITISEDIDFKEVIYKLKYYSIESYCFGEKCLNDILDEYLVEWDKEASEFLKFIYNGIIDKILYDAFIIGILGILTHGNIIKSNLSYGVSEGIFTKGTQYKSILQNELTEYKEKIEHYIESNSLQCNFITVRKITKGKHLIYLIARELNNYMKILEKGKMCDKFKECIDLNAFCELSSEQCFYDKCKFSIETIHGTAFGRDNLIGILQSAIKANADLNECNEISEVVSKKINKLNNKDETIVMMSC